MEIQFSNADTLAVVKEVLNKNADAIFTAKGTSMLPFVKNNDELTISNKIKPRLGSIVAIEKNSLLIIHRIVRINNGVYTIKGDNAKRPDGEFSSVLGVVCSVKRHGIRKKLGITRFNKPVAVLSRTNALSLIHKSLYKLLKQKK